MAILLNLIFNYLEIKEKIEMELHLYNNVNSLLFFVPLNQLSAVEQAILKSSIVQK